MNDPRPGDRPPADHDLQAQCERLRRDLSEAVGEVARLSGGLEDARAQLAAFRAAVAANLASLNEIVAEMTSVTSGDPEFTAMTYGVLRDHTWALGFEFRGEARPAGWDDRRHEEEPEEPDWDPGPEVDDQGGMSDYLRQLPDDYLPG